MVKRLLVLFLLLSGIVVIMQAQEESAPANWDNQIYLGNKVSYGKYDWRFSTELQTRLRGNMQNLDNWYVEEVATFLYSEHIEIVPDFRVTVKPTKMEFRPGVGVLYKKKFDKLHFVNQVKWQTDFSSNGSIAHAFREVVFLNYRYNDNIVLTSVAGFIYRWRDDWNGFQYVRLGPGVSYIFDETHILNFSYFVGLENTGTYTQWAGIPMIQLVININKSYKYAPAYYFSF